MIDDNVVPDHFVTNCVATARHEKLQLSYEMLQSLFIPLSLLQVVRHLFSINVWQCPSIKRIPALLLDPQHVTAPAALCAVGNSIMPQVGSSNPCPLWVLERLHLPSSVWVFYPTPDTYSGSSGQNVTKYSILMSKMNMLNLTALILRCGWHPLWEKTFTGGRK